MLSKTVWSPASISSPARSPVAFWDISVIFLALDLFGEVCNAVLDVGGGTAAGGEAHASVNIWMAAAVGRAAISLVSLEGDFAAV